MDIIPTEITDVIEIRPQRFGDARGWFSEVYRREALLSAGLVHDFVQDNESFSASVGTLRGLHYQLPPFTQDKLVRVLRGSIFDVAVDLRHDSPTFAQHVVRTLTAEAGNQLLVPAGFAHGFLTLTPDAHVAYKVTAPYSPEAERAIRWDDPEIGIEWPRLAAGPTLSDKDAAAPLLTDQPDLF